MKVWLSGPLFDEPKAAMDTFEKVAEELRQRGLDPVLPQDVPPWRHSGEDCPGPRDYWGHSPHCYMRKRIPAMLSCDAVLFLPGAMSDRWSRAERRAASTSGLQLFHKVAELPMLSADPGTAEIIAEIKSMELPDKRDFPNEMPVDYTVAGPVLQEDDDWFHTADPPYEPELDTSQDAYERGLSDGEDAFWRKLGTALSEAGMPKLKSARLLANLAVTVEDNAPERQEYEVAPGHPTVVFKGTAHELAERMKRYGENQIQLRGYRIPHRATAREMMGHLITFVTGVKA